MTLSQVCFQVHFGFFVSKLLRMMVHVAFLVLEIDKLDIVQLLGQQNVKYHSTTTDYFSVLAGQ